jgi:hypothetical protein
MLPFADTRLTPFRAAGDCRFVSLARQQVEQFMKAVPQFSYLLRKYRVEQNRQAADWLLGAVSLRE